MLLNHVRHTVNYNKALQISSLLVSNFAYKIIGSFCSFSVSWIKMNMISSCHSLTPHFKIVLSFEILIVQFITVTFRVHVNGLSKKLHTILC